MGASFSVCTVPIRQFKYTNLLYIVLQITIRRIGLAEKNWCTHRISTVAFLVNVLLLSCTPRVAGQHIPAMNTQIGSTV